MCIRDRVTPVAVEPMLGYHPCSIGFLTCAREPGGGQCQTGSLTGAVASERAVSYTHLEFKGGSFKAATKSKCPIVPVALIDSYKAFDTGSVKKLIVQVHFLEPIYLSLIHI